MSPYRCFRACATGVLAPIVVIGADLHVAPSGDDANTGTLAQPFATISRAELASDVGDTIHLHEGVYRESVLFRTSGTEAQPITYRAYTDGSGTDTVTISGFDLIEPGMNGAGQWQLHQGSIYKIQLNSSYGLFPGASTVLLNESALKIARWPNGSRAFDFNWVNMALPDAASLDPNSGGPQLPFAGTFHTATYQDTDLPYLLDDQWVGARIDMSPGGGVFQTTGHVVASDDGSITFRYPRDDTQEVSVGDPYFLWNTLAALDEEGEYFFDIEGTSGSPFTLYLWAPGGVSPDTLQVEIKSRDFGLDINNVHHLVVENLTLLGGGVFCPSSSGHLKLDRVHFRHCGQGLDYLSPQRAAIWLRSDDHLITNCLVEDTFGGGIHAAGDQIEITNNVIRNCMLYSIGTWGGNGITANHNTTYLNGGLNIAMFSPASEFNYNHCYLAGLRTTDKANMNSHFNGDAQNTEVAYNWVHTNVARLNPTFGWGGGGGIRLDTSPSNFVIHHNVIWGMSKPTHSLILFSLDAQQVNSGNSMIRAYNNTVAGGIVFPSFGSLGGHDVRNNLCTEIREFGVQIDDAIIQNNYLTIGKYVDTWPGNFFTDRAFISAPTGNFELESGVPMVDGGELIAPYTDGFAGAAPDVGALESTGGESSFWNPGALLLPEHFVDLTLTTLTKPSGQSFVVLGNLPPGRLPTDEFAVRLNGNSTLTDSRIVYDTVTHRGEAYFEFDPASHLGTNVIELSLDGVAFSNAGQTIFVSAGGLSVDQLVDAGAAPSGGSVHRMTGSGFSPPYWMMPITMQNLVSADLNSKPVPIVFNSRDHIQQGRMNSDCSDVRLVHWETQTELPYYLESGVNGEATLLWTKLEQNLLTQRFSQLDESSYYMTFGVPSRLALSDWDVLGTYFDILNHPDRLLWFSATKAGETLVDGEAVNEWTDLSGLDNHGLQSNPDKQPTFRTQQMNGLPALRFDGGDFLDLGSLAASPPTGLTYVILHRNDINCESTGRFVSAGANGMEVQFVRAHSSRETWELLSTRRPGVELGNVTTGRRFNNDIAWYTGEIAEMLIFGEHLDDATDGPYQRILEYVSRKYTLNGEARGIPDPGALLPPLEVLIGGQPATSVTFINPQTVEFVAPVAPPGSLPLTFDLEVRRDQTVVTAPERFSYFIPAFESWAAYLPEESNQPNDNPDVDAIPNLLEFAMDLDPLLGDALPLGSFGPSGNPRLHFRRNPGATDVRVLLEHSPDYQSWNRSELTDMNLQVVDPDPDGDGTAVLYRIDLPNDSRCFWRFVGIRLGE